MIFIFSNFNWPTFREAYNKDVEVIFEVKKNTGRFATAIRGFPLGESTFLGIENYYELVFQTIKDLQRLFNINLENIELIGGSDAAPFASNFEMEIENSLMLKENFEVLPTSKLISLNEFDLKRNSDDKNKALAFKRAFYLKDYLIKYGISNSVFVPIKVAFLSTGGANSSFRKCEARLRFKRKD